MANDRVILSQFLHFDHILPSHLFLNFWVALLCDLHVRLFLVNLVTRSRASSLQVVLPYIADLLILVSLAVEQVLCALNHRVCLDIGAIEPFVLNRGGLHSFDFPFGVCSSDFVCCRLLD